MSILVYDTHKFVTRMTKAGMPQPQAEVLAESHVELMETTLATKQDLKDLGADLTGEMKNLDDKLTGEMKDLRADLTGEMKNLDDKLTGEMKDLRADLTGEMKNLDDKLTGEMKDLEGRLTGEMKDLRCEMKDLRAELHSKIDQATLKTIGIITAVMVGLAAVMTFLKPGTPSF